MIAINTIKDVCYLYQNARNNLTGNIELNSIVINYVNSLRGTPAYSIIKTGYIKPTSYRQTQKAYNVTLVEYRKICNNIVNDIKKELNKYYAARKRKLKKQKNVIDFYKNTY